MVLWMRVFINLHFLMPEQSQDFWDKRHIQSWADLVKIIHISETEHFCPPDSLKCGSVSAVLCMLTMVGVADAWLNIMKSINSKCVMFLACLFSNWDYNCCVSKSCSDWGPESQQMTRVPAFLPFITDQVNFMNPEAEFYTMKTVYLRW